MMPGLQLDLTQQIVNVHWGGADYYVIVAATNNDYAESNGGKVRVLDTQSVAFSDAEGAEPISGTLIESPGNAGANFITLNPTSHNINGLENIFVYVCPKTDDVREKWFDYVMAPYDATLQDDDGLPLGPFLWAATTMSGSPNVMHFKIRITDDAESDDRLVQAYPTSGNNSWPYGNGTTYVITGWQAMAYRLNRDGTGEVKFGPEEWYPDDVVEYLPPSPLFSPTKGLKFGDDPQPIFASAASMTRDLPMPQSNVVLPNAALSGGGVPPEDRP